MVDRQMEELHREIREIRRNMSGVDTQIEELQGQYALMENKIATTRRLGRKLLCAKHRYACSGTAEIHT